MQTVWGIDFYFIDLDQVSLDRTTSTVIWQNQLRTVASLTQLLGLSAVTRCRYITPGLLYKGAQQEDQNDPHKHVATLPLTYLHL